MKNKTGDIVRGSRGSVKEVSAPMYVGLGERSENGEIAMAFFCSNKVALN